MRKWLEFDMPKFKFSRFVLQFYQLKKIKDKERNVSLESNLNNKCQI